MNGDEYSYIRGRSTAGFIYTHNGMNEFFYTTAEPNRTTMVFPPRYFVCTSEMGLVLLCRHGYGAANANANTLYRVSNPSYADFYRSIPSPQRPHPSPMPRVLIVVWDSARLCLVFHIVCAVQAANPTCYSFDVFSSITDTWESTGTTQVHLGLTIKENTGVACGTRAYWLLDSRVPTVAYYDVHGGRAGTISLSHDECPPHSIACFPQLGRWGCQLCLVVISDQLKKVCIFTLGQDDRWLRYHDWPYGNGSPPTLSRFQSAKLQVPLWCEVGIKWYEVAEEQMAWNGWRGTDWSMNRIVFLENGWRGRTDLRYHAWPRSNSPEPDFIGYALPHVASDWHPGIHFPIVP